MNVLGGEQERRREIELLTKRCGDELLEVAKGITQVIIIVSSERVVFSQKYCREYFGQVMEKKS